MITSMQKELQKELPRQQGSKTQDVTRTDSENLPPMLNKENYVPWSSRLLRYVKSRPNGKLIYNSIINGPYTDDELMEAEIKQMEADDQAIQTILLSLPEDIYAAVDSCETAQEIWFTSTDGESIESYYHRFSKLMNYFKRNKHFPEKIATDYTLLYDFLKYNQKEVDELRAERLAKTQDPLALMANFNNPFIYPVFYLDLPSSSAQNVGNQNGLIVVSGIANQNGNGNVVAAQAECWELKSFYKIMLLKDLILLVEIIEEGNSFKPVARTTTNEDGTSATTIPSAVTAEQNILKKNDLKARSILMMTLPSEHLLTFNKHKDAKSLFEAIEARFGESLDSIFNRLQKIVSQLTILGEIITPEELNLKLLRSLPTEWGMHVVVWRNKSDPGLISFDDLYNNFKIVEPKVKRSVISSSNSGSQNLAFLSGHSSTNDVNTANVHVSTGSTSVSTASINNSTACLSDATVYAYLATQPNGSQVVHEDLEQIHEDDNDEMDLKWQLALLSMKARKFYQRTGKKIIINGSDTAGYDKKKVECFNCHKLGHFARECRNPKSQENTNISQDSSRRTVNVEESSSKAMLAIDGTIAIKKGLASVEEQLVIYKKNESMLYDQISVLKRDAPFNESDINALKKQVERLKKEKEDNQFKIDNFENASKSLDQLIGNQISNNNKKGLGYIVVNKGASENVSKEVKKTSDAPIIEDWVSDCDEDETVVLESLNVQKPKQVDQPRKVSKNPRNNSTRWNTPMPKKLGVGFQFTPKACFVCGSFNHLIKECDFHDKRMVQKPVLNNVKKGTGQKEVRPVWTNAMRVNHQKISNSRRNFSPTTVLTKSGLVPFSIARQSFSRTKAPVSVARKKNDKVLLGMET
ncbi:putative ribonuclease H-like domain-containing protein [Tanacetum coccineum]